jgi:AcrR family transcriptional regulator
VNGIAPISAGEERVRLEQAFAAVVCERGFAEASAEAVAERAGCDLEAYHRHFTDLEDCLCEYIQAGTVELLMRSAKAFDGVEGWREQLRAVAHTMLHFLRENPARARIMVVEVLSAGERAQLIRDQGMEGLFAFIDAGRSELDDPDSISRATAEAVGGAIFSRLRMQIETGGTDSLPELLPKMMYTAVLPYLGPEAAAEELRIPPPQAS